MINICIPRKMHTHDKQKAEVTTKKGIYTLNWGINKILHNIVANKNLNALFWRFCFE